MDTIGPASPKSPRTLADLVTCPVCLETFRDPKSLACLHTFCANCLENCRRPFSQDIACPVCTRRTPLSPRGIMGLQNDFRVQQIQDILASGSGSPVSVPTSSADDRSLKMCDICKSESRNNSASYHCIQCYMFFCTQCIGKHESNVIFNNHHVVSLADVTAADTLFCKSHRSHSVRYFCEVCTQLLCVICTMSHDPSHKPVSLEKGIVEKYRQELQQSLKLIRTRLSEVNSKSKYLEVVKQAQQVALNDVQTTIRQRTEELIAAIKRQESHLLAEVQQRMDAKMQEYGLDNLDRMRLKKCEFEELFKDVQTLIEGTPQQCLLNYEKSVARIQAIVQSSTPAVKKDGNISVVKFVPFDDLNIVIGRLQEATIRNEGGGKECGEARESSSESASAPSAGTSSLGGQNIVPNSPERASMASTEEVKVLSQTPSRRAAVLSALAGTTSRKQPKFRRMKVSSAEKSYDASKSSSSSAINADTLLNSPGMSTVTVKSIFGQSPMTSILSAPVSQPSASSTSADNSACTSSMPSSSPRSEMLRLHFPPVNSPKLLFSVSRTGGWTGKLESPQSVAFLPDGNVVLAECSSIASRLQVFDRSGSSVRIMAWGQVHPYGVAANSGGMIFAADKKERCVKVFSMEGVYLWAWHGRVSMPYAIAASSNSSVIVTDTDSKTVTIFGADGSVVNQFGSWGSADGQFMQPSGVTTDVQENIYVSDTINQCVQVFDKTGAFIKRMKLGASGEFVAVPDGITCDRKGRVLLCDRERNTVAMLTPDGRQVPVVKSFGSLKYPVSLAVDKEDRLAVIESHSGFLSPEQHCGFKVFQM